MLIKCPEGLLAISEFFSLQNNITTCNPISFYNPKDFYRFSRFSGLVGLKQRS